MLGEFLTIFSKSLKLDKSLYKDSRYFGEAGIYFAGLIMILDGVAGAVAANTIVKTAIKLKVNVMNYLYDRVTKKFTMPSLASLTHTQHYWLEKSRNPLRGIAN